jgi:FkbM family methyltransferase
MSLMTAPISHTLESLLIAWRHPSFCWLRWSQGVDLRHATRLKRLKDEGYLDGVTHVIDAGANVGAYAKAMASVLPEATIHCFEPAPATFDKLRQNTARLRNVRAYNLALGAQPATLPMFTCPMDESNSLLKSTAILQDSWAKTRPTGQVQVEVSRLDDLLVREKAQGRLFIKVDVQGYEIELLKGATTALQQCVLLQVEVSLVPLYENAPMLPEVWDYVSRSGLKFLMFDDLLHSSRNQQPVSCDLYFYRPAQPLV